MQTIENNPKWIIRQPTPDDIAFIYATWLNSYYYDSWAKSIRKSVYYNNYKRVVDKLLNEADISIACMPENQNVIFGYMVTEPGIIHYSFVKEDFRHFGIAKALYQHSHPHPDDKIEITHLTRSVHRILEKNLNFIFNPIRLFNQEIIT